MSNQISIQKEKNEAYDAVRSGIGVIDLSETGRIVVKGEGHVEFLDGLVTKDIMFMEEETTLFTLLLQEDGTVIDIINLFKNEDSITIITTAHKKGTVLAWLENQKTNGIEIIDISQTHSLLGFEGPYAWRLAQKFLDFEISSLPFQSFVLNQLFGKEILLARTGVTAEYGYQLLFEKYLEPIVVETINSFKDDDINLKRVNWETLETLMLEIRHPYFEFKHLEELNIFEASLEWFIDFYKDEFYGRESLEQQSEAGVNKRIVGFTTGIESRITVNDEIFIEEQLIGKVIELKESPVLNMRLGIALLEEPFAVSGIGFYVKNKENTLYEAHTQSSPYILPKSWSIKIL
ncbi:aminomethyltransferase [Bacillus thuringiensis]|uniref:Aminomethyltransferase n=1 Tax=Bacillus thuringiensis TaxID=1428 RepID=A0A9X6TYU9_BACTU|nr:MULTISPECIES: aminomethyltransferase family protein [Bacillus cereus group]MCC2543879.1 aminomethyltransferase family protein [Bacillus thuringiensis]MDF9547332.1 aminomethyltransferase family protein [Bacillus cereus]PDX91056.1 aminomethyltransferase [Bacillus thuringiensis]PED13221.1 aminomethyltransferase [Bacillus thuringiensis]PEE66420.1 aminomethyltransferase [Bacillus thuringiensis]